MANQSPVHEEICKTARVHPLSPHLGIYRRTITMMMSIMHRMTGAFLYFGILLVVSRIVAISDSESTFVFVNAWFVSPLGHVFSVMYIWALLHHMFGGIRHLFQDLGYGLDSSVASRISWAILCGSLGAIFLIGLGLVFSGKGGG